MPYATALWELMQSEVDRRIKAAGAEEIARVEGVNAALAERIYAALHGLGPQSPATPSRPDPT